MGQAQLVETCDSAHSWRFYSAVSLEHQVASTMTHYPIQSHYPDTEPTRLCPILIMQGIWLRSDLPHARTVRSRFGHRARFGGLVVVVVRGVCRSLCVSMCTGRSVRVSVGEWVSVNLYVFVWVGL